MVVTIVSFIPYFRLLVFVFWYFGHFSCVIFFPFFPRLAMLNVNKDYVIFLYFRNFINKSDQKRKIG